MGLPQPVRKFSPEEYYALEQEAEYRSEYYQGEIFAMAGGSIEHSEICSNIIRFLGNRLDGSPCKALESNLRIRIKPTGLRAYADVTVLCGPREKDPEDPLGQTIVNPTVVFEVLSTSTIAYDRGFKAENYRQIESLRAYVLVSQSKAHVEVYARQASGGWLLLEAHGLDSKVAIPGTTVELPLSEIYYQVTLSGEEMMRPVE